MLGGHKAQGRQWQEARALYDTALALEAAGCFAIVLECVPEPVAAAISRRLAIPTIGIGSGAGHRRPGAGAARHARHRARTRPLPRFVKRYAEIGAAMRDGVERLRERGARAGVPRRRAHLSDRRPRSSSAFETAIGGGSARGQHPRRLVRRGRIGGMTTFLHTMVRITDPREEPRVLRGARLQLGREHGHRPKRRARGDQLLLQPARQHDVLELTLQPRRPQLRDGHRLRAHRRSASPTSTPRSSSSRPGHRARAAALQVSEGGSRLCFVRDPDGYRIEIIGRG